MQEILSHWLRQLLSYMYTNMIGDPLVMEISIMYENHASDSVGIYNARNMKHVLTFSLSNVSWTTIGTNGQ